MINKIKYHIGKTKYYWKDNKIVMLKHFRNIFVCGLRKFFYIKHKKDEKKVELVIKGKKEITLDINYNSNIHSKIILPTEDKGLTKDLILNPIREPTELGLFIKEVEDGMNVIDIGANLGIYLLLEPHLTKGKIYGIEPNPKAFEFLKRSVKLNNFKNIKLINMGISDKKGNLPFYISEKWNWCRFTKTGEDIVDVKNIKVDSLDSLFKNKKIDIVRMDVEGYEVNILEGMKKLIKNNSSMKIFVEYHADMFNTKQRIRFAEWLKENKLKIKYSLRSEKDRIVKINKNINLNKLKNMEADYCLVLERIK